jgi:predicted ATPase
MGPLRGRDSECARLGRLVAEAVDGAGGIAIVEGAAGIGKSRLLAEAAQIAAGLGVQTAAGACDELDQVTPWAPLLGALSSTAPMLMSAAELAPLRALPDQRLAVIECIRTALERASHRRPLLITLDDLQWADPATLLAPGIAACPAVLPPGRLDRGAAATASLPAAAEPDRAADRSRSRPVCTSTHWTPKRRRR